MILKPPPLEPEDTIGIVSPSGRVKGKDLQGGIEYLRQRGYKVKVGKSAYGSKGYLAGGDDQRAQDINDMFCDPEVKAIFASRGGYGSTRILDKIDYDLIRRNPKIFVGFSDTTALQLSIFRYTGLVTFSGVLAAVDMKDAKMNGLTEKTLWDLLTKGRIDIIEGLEIMKGGSAEGKLLGGCLSIMCSLLGTAYQPDLKGAILFLEDVDEAPYRIDRMLTQLSLSGLLQQVSGIILGQFQDCFDRDESSEVEELSLKDMVDDLMCDLNIPILSDLPYGHFASRVVLPIGVNARIDGNTGKLEITESALD